MGEVSGDAWYRGVEIEEKERWDLGERGSGTLKRAYIVQSNSDMKIKLKRGISRPPSCWLFLGHVG